MIGERIALLVGMFGVPAYLLMLGNRFRNRSPSERGRFWGGVIGHSLGLASALTAMMAPPIWWAGGSFVRDFAVHWSMLVLGVAGVLIGTIAHKRA